MAINEFLVYEHAGEVAGIAVGYPAEDEKIIDEPLEKSLKTWLSRRCSAIY